MGGYVCLIFNLPVFARTWMTQKTSYLSNKAFKAGGGGEIILRPFILEIQ